MRVQRPNPSLLMVFIKDVFDDDDISPRLPGLFGKHNATIGHSKPRLAEVSVAAIVSIPIFAGMNAQTVAFAKLRRRAPTVMRFARRLER